MAKNALDIDYKRIIENSEELGLYQCLTRDILYYLKNNSSATFNEIIKNVGGSDRRTLRLLDQMVTTGMIRFKNNNFFSISRTHLHSQKFLCKHCQGKIVNIEGGLEKIRSKMGRIYLQKPKPTFVFDQRPVNCTTTLRRAAYSMWRRDIQGKKIAIIGDDDLTGLAIAFMNVAKEIIVFDIDHRLIEFINKKAKENNLKLKAVFYDLNNSLPSKYLNHFDLFMADPTPTKIPFTLFTSVGVKLLKKQSGVGYLSIYPSCMQKNMDLQKVINKMGLLITDMIPFFTEYDFIKETYSNEDLELLNKYSKGKSEMSFFEYLVRIETTKETKSFQIKYSPEDLLGKATKRVLSNPNKDPAILTNDPYVKTQLKKRIESLKKRGI